MLHVFHDPLRCPSPLAELERERRRAFAPAPRRGGAESRRRP